MRIKVLLPEDALAGDTLSIDGDIVAVTQQMIDFGGLITTVLVPVEAIALNVKAIYNYSNGNPSSVDMDIAEVERNIAQMIVVVPSDINETDGIQKAFDITLSENSAVSVLPFSIEASLESVQGVDYTDLQFTNGVTYNSEFQLLIIPPNVTQFDINVKATVDDLTEGDETIVINLNGSPYISTIADSSLSKASLSLRDVSDDAVALESSQDGIQNIIGYKLVLEELPATDAPVSVRVSLQGVASAGTSSLNDYYIQGLTQSDVDSITYNPTDGYIDVMFSGTTTEHNFNLISRNDTNDPNSVSLDGYGGEGNESVVLKIEASDSYQITLSQSTVDGLILDNSPVSIPEIRGDMTTQVGPEKSVLEDPSSSNSQLEAATAQQLLEAEGGLVTTDYDDSLFVGYFLNGELDPDNDKGGVVSYFPDNTNNVDGQTGRTTIDLGEGDDIIKIAANQAGSTRVYLGEGDDIYNVVGNISAGSLFSSLLFAESGDDQITIGASVTGGQVFAGSGSDTITVTDIQRGGGTNFPYTSPLVDLGSGRDLTSMYSSQMNNANSIFYSDNNEDSITDINTLTVSGSILDRAEVYGGDGIDNIKVSGVVDRSEIHVGNNNDTLDIVSMQRNSIIDLGAGDDTLIFNGFGASSLNGDILGGAGVDTIKLTSTDASVFSNTNATTNMGTDVFTGIEHIDMQGNNVVDIRYNELLSDTTNTGPLYITGDSGDKVDLMNDGSAYDGRNYNSNDASDADFGDWSTASDFTDAGGITYNVWHNSSAGTDISNDVYIQQDIVVI